MSFSRSPIWLPWKIWPLKTLVSSPPPFSERRKRASPSGAKAERIWARYSLTRARGSSWLVRAEDKLTMRFRLLKPWRSARNLRSARILSILAVRARMSTGFSR